MKLIAYLLALLLALYFVLAAAVSWITGTRFVAMLRGPRYWSAALADEAQDRVIDSVVGGRTPSAALVL